MLWQEQKGLSSILYQVDNEAYEKLQALCSTTDIAIKNNVEVGFNKAVKAGIIKIIGTNDKKKTTSQLDIELNQF